jgi:hypothetical protein
MKAGGAYVLGGAKICPQASGPLFTLVAGSVPAGRGFRRARGGPGGAGGDGQERVGEHRQGDVAVPGAVPADLVVVQASLILGLSDERAHDIEGGDPGGRLQLGPGWRLLGARLFHGWLRLHLLAHGYRICSENRYLGSRE